MRARVTFSKTGSLRYTGHLDLQTLWERAGRRAGLPLAYSHGFHPQPKISFASALPLGFTSSAEVMDMRLQTDIDLNLLPQQLQAVLPTGISILGVQEVDESEPALQTQITAAEYEATLIENVDAVSLQAALARVLAATSLPRERRGKAYDLRPLIESLSIRPDAGSVISMRLSAREGATGRPDEVLAELGIPANSTRIERTRLIFQ